MKRVLREPLLHFVLLGAGIFAAYGLVSERSSTEPGKIIVTQGELESMVVGFTRTWQRPPSSEDLDRLINDRVREEVYYREAMALGLDKDDTVIRRRLRQKMEFITDDVSTQIQPSDEELEKFLAADPDSFRIGDRFSFTQVYLDREKYGANVARVAEQLRSQLNRVGGDADVSELGDATLLEHSYWKVPGTEIGKQFGDTFVASLRGLSGGQWQGPIESGYGLHFVYVRERETGGMPALADVREAVRTEWTNARRLETTEKFYDELRSKYQVTVERPRPIEEMKVAANGAR